MSFVESNAFSKVALTYWFSEIFIPPIVNKLVLNESKIADDLEDNWAVVSEAIQTILRREGFPKPYEKLKDLTRTNSVIDKNAIQEFIKKLKVSEEVKQEMLAITPSNYIGKAV